MTIALEVDGEAYEGFLNASVELSLEELSNQFFLSASSEEGVPLPFLGGEACRVLVEGESVLSGFIEVVEPSGGEEDHTIRLHGRDRTCDLLDSQIAAHDDIRARGLTLKQLIEIVLKHIAGDETPTLSVVDLLNPAPFNEAEDLHAPDPGEGAFDWLERMARKRQALITSDGDGNLVITRSSGIESGGYLIHRPNDAENNVMSYSGSYDQTGLYRRYVNSSQLNPVAALLAKTIGKESEVDQPAEIEDTRIRVGRQYVLDNESMMSSGQALDRLKWQKNIARARSRTMTFTVDGYRDQTGDLWRLNRIIRVESVFLGIASRMLCKHIKFSLDETGGSHTALTMVPRDAFTIAQAEPQVEKETGLDFSLDT